MNDIKDELRGASEASISRGSVGKDIATVALKRIEQLEGELAEARAAVRESNWRPFVVAMANAMEETLRANDHKNDSGWDGLSEVLAKLMEEVAELAREASVYGASESLLKEAADVANLAGMVVRYVDSTMPSYAKARAAEEG